VIERLVVGLLVSMLFSVGGWWAGALAPSGALAALAVGIATIVGLSWPGALVLGTFFVTSSLLSRLARHNRVAAKGGRRDERQVLANGGVAALAGLSALWVEPVIAFGIFSAALSAATADTWGTEIGSRSRLTPVLLLSRRAVLPGESGGVTRLGTLGSLAGAVAVGMLSGTLAWLALDAARPVTLAAIVAAAGMAGSLADSLLGEKVQERRWCPACELPAEALVHDCGARTVHVGGRRRIDNDVVNLTCTAIGALVGSLAVLTM